MANELDGKSVAFLFTDGVEQVELTEPLKAVRKAGADVDLVSLQEGEVQMFNHLDKGETIEADRAVSDVDASSYDALVIPGGVANPDRLRTDADAVRFVRDFFEQDKPIGIICHGSLDARRGGRGPRPHRDLVAEPPDRPAQRRRDLGRRAGRRRQRARDEPQAG